MENTLGFKLKDFGKLTILAIAFFLISSTSVKKYNVTLSVTQTSSYCGGAQPPKDLINQLNTPNPLANKKLFVRRGKTNNLKSKIILSLTSDSLGNCNFKLPAGTYCIIDETKKDYTYYNKMIKQYALPTKTTSAIDKQCLKTWLNTPDAILTIKDSVNAFTVNFHKICSFKINCVQYSGPLPP